MTQHVVSALAEKIAEISGQIEHHQAIVSQLEKQKAGLATAMSVFDPNYNVAQVKPKRQATRSQWFQPGEGMRLVLAEFRKAAGQPLSARQAADALAAVKGLAFIQPKDKLQFSNAVENIFQRLHVKKTIVSVGRVNGASVKSWTLAAQPGQAAIGN
jgi:hypothetical protein